MQKSFQLLNHPVQLHSALRFARTPRQARSREHVVDACRLPSGREQSALIRCGNGSTGAAAAAAAAAASAAAGMISGLYSPNEPSERRLHFLLEPTVSSLSQSFRSGDFHPDNGGGERREELREKDTMLQNVSGTTARMGHGSHLYCNELKMVLVTGSK